MLDALSLPATLVAVHVYLSLSPSLEPAISNEPSSSTVYRPLLEIRRPSCFHVTVGVGTPLALHWIVMIVRVSAVTFSPMVSVTGLLS